jgi:hypothetical protein
MDPDRLWFNCPSLVNTNIMSINKGFMWEGKKERKEERYKERKRGARKDKQEKRGRI